MANLVILAIAYTLYPGYIDHGEPAISAMAWKMLGGTPVYHGFDAADRTTNIYGPFVYLWHAWPLALFGPSIPTGKIAATLAGVLIPVLGWRIARGRHPLAGWLCAFAAIMVVIHLNAPLVIRPDALLTVLVGITVLAAARWGTASGWLATAVIGIAAGIAVNVKLHAAVYLAPAVLFHLWNDWRRLPVMAALAVATATAPFVFPSFPWQDYVAWFGPISAKENVWKGFALLWWKLALYFMPLLILAAGGRAAWGGLDRPTRVYFLFYGFCLLLVLFPATKLGAGDHYYLPFLPVAVDLGVRALAAGGHERRQRLVTTLLVLVALAAAYQPERRFLKRMEWDLSRGVNTEIEQILADYPGRRIQMGVGRPYTERGDQLSFHFYLWRTPLIYRGNPYTIEASIMMELTKLGVPFPDEALRRFASCHTEIWLTPKDSEPFMLQGYYLQPVFSREVMDTFLAHHRRIDSREFYDLWECRPDTNG